MKRALQRASYVGVSCIVGALAAAAVSGCGDDTTTTESSDAGVDSSLGSPDAGVSSPTPEAGPADGGSTEDTGSTASDSGADGSSPGLDGSQGDATAGDAGSDAATVAVMDAASDTSIDTGTVTAEAGGNVTLDAAADVGVDAGTFCENQTGLDFCADFDETNSLVLDGGALAGWSLPPVDPADLSIASGFSVSAPNSLYANLERGDDGGTTSQSTKVIEMLSPVGGLSQAIYEFDMAITRVPLAAPNVNPGGFATDFQFFDVGNNSDQFGFRISIFSNGTTFDHANLEHNHPTLGGPDDITSIALLPLAWQHVKMVVAFAAAADAGATVAFQLYLDGSATAAVNAVYPAPFAKAPFARFAAGLVYAFQGDAKDWGIHYDNFTLKLQ